MTVFAERIIQRLGATPEDEESDDIGELEIAEYVVFLLALDTYIRYLKEATGSESEDDLIRKGIQLIRLADRRHLDTIKGFIGDSLKSSGQKKMLNKAFRFLPTNSVNMGLRSFNLRTVLSRGGPPTMRAVFKTNKALQGVRNALAASMMDDADMALDKFAAIPLRNQRLRKWIDVAAEIAGSGSFQNATAIGASEAIDDVAPIRDARVQQDAAPPTSDDNKDSLSKKDDLLLEVQQKAQDAAQRAMVVSGEVDEPPVKSEVIGIATAAAIAAVTDPSNSSNIPAPLRKLDDEQRAAALTDGRVLVAAGAGAGKCVRGDTLVRTANGLFPIQDFGQHLEANQTSDFKTFVLSIQGLEPTSSIINNGEKETIRLTTRLGYQLEGTPNHPILVLHGGKIQWITLGELSDDDFICIDRRPGIFSEPLFTVSHRTFVKVTNSEPSEIPSELTEQVASLLGYIVSEGHVIYGHHSLVDLTTTDTDQLELYKAAVQGIITKWSFGYDSINEAWYVKFFRRSNLEALADFGLTFTLAHEKEIPVGILQSPEKIIIAFLRALFDGDGGFYRHEIFYCSASVKLARQVHCLLLSFGIVSKLRFRPNPKKGSWYISITGDNARLFLQKIGFNLKRKQEAAETAFMQLTPNPNLDAVPGLAGLFYAIMDSAKTYQKISEHPKYHAFKCYRMGTRNPSVKLIKEFLQAFPVDSAEYQELKIFSNLSWFYDSIDELELSKANVFDFVIPGTHSFSANGFVNHNSSTLVSRVEYLVKDRRVMPSRILVTSFNTKAANELKQKIGSTVGGEALQQMSVGTMHSLFRKFIGEYGTSQERNAMGLGKDRGGFVQGGGAVARAVQRIWSECFPAGSRNERKVPKLKNVLTAKSKWAGNDVSPAEAKEKARSRNEIDAADWYEMYEGLMGTTPNWKPPCGTSKGYESFMARWRPDDRRLGDFDSMISIFLDILKREPAVKKTIQSMFDHIIVDEAQDQNSVQRQTLEFMAEHITDGKDGKSFWIVGDPNQSIYEFRGARPDLFNKLNKTEGWTTKMIRTNYRCQPEIVDLANKLIAHNEKQISMEAVPSPAKVRGVGSVKVENPSDEAEAALDTVEEIKANIAAGEDVAGHAILTRTNKEQHAFETACIIRGIPYARKGAASFLGSPETKAFLGYIQLVTGDNFAKMQASLGEVINKPNRFFITPEAGNTAVSEALSVYARRNGLDIKSANPIVALIDPYFRSVLAEKLSKSRSGFKFDKTIEKLFEIQRDIAGLKADTEDPAFTTRDLFDGILGMTGTAAVTDSSGRTKYVDQTFRDSLKADIRDTISDDDDTDDEEEGETEGLGNVSFLYKLVEKDPTDPEDSITDPNTPFGFKAKMERYAARVKDLRIDLSKWDKQQEALPPEQRKAPPGVFLGTVHSTKGAQFLNVYVSMPKGKFPFEPPQKPGEPPSSSEEVKEEMESERRLGYVALTRAVMNLTVICPNVVGGKVAGISRFVDEAGLSVGENVPKPGAPIKEEVLEPIKTATHEEWDPSFDYDRRT